VTIISRNAGSRAEGSGATLALQEARIVLVFHVLLYANCRRSRYDENMPILTKRGAHIPPFIRANSSRSEMLRETSLCVSFLCVAIILNGKCTLHYFTFVLKGSPELRSSIFNELGLSPSRRISDDTLRQELHYECKNKSPALKN